MAASVTPAARLTLRWGSARGLLHHHSGHGLVLQTPSQALRHGRSLIRELAARHRTANPRVFGSVVTGQDREGSDLDVLVEPLPETTLFDLGGLQDALEEALGVRVDVKTPMDLPPHIRADVLRQAVPV